MKVESGQPFCCAAAAVWNSGAHSPEGGDPKPAGARSGEANLPISLGIPAAVVGAGGYSQGIHSKDEWFDPANAYLGPSKALLAIVGLVGIDGMSAPILQKRPPRQ